MRKTVSVVLFLIANLSFVSAANAEYFGMLNGRGGDLRNLSDLSVEGGIITGDLGDASYDLIGARVNYRLMPGLILYGDFGITDVGEADGNAIGLGAYYQLQDLISDMHTSVRASFHQADVEGTAATAFGTFSVEADFDILSVEFLISGQQPIMDNGMMWYGNASINRLDNGRTSDTEPGFGGGVYLPLGPGEAYAGVDWIDELMFGVGYRFSLR